MKGVLKNKEGKWVVEFLQKLTNVDIWTNELSLHPEDVRNLEIGFTDKFTKEVEFEIVDGESWTDAPYGAKLITSPKQEVSEEAKRRVKILYAPSHKKYIESPKQEGKFIKLNLDTHSIFISNSALKQEESSDLSKVTRLEVIDHSPKGTGRAFVKYDIKELELSYQDDGRTLKIFIK